MKKKKLYSLILGTLILLTGLMGLPNLVLPSVPNAPNFLKAEYSGINTDMVLVWSNVAFHTSYTLFWSTNNATNSANKIAGFNAGDTNYTHTNSILNKTNYYWVQAYNSEGPSGYSSVGKDIFLLPSTPEFLKAEYLGANVELIWSDAGDETAYLLYRSTDVNITNFIINLPGNTTNYLDPGSALGPTNYYWVKASNLLGVSGFSKVTNVVLKVPDAPTDLTAVIPIDSQDIKITWNKVDTAGVGIAASYTLFRSTANDPNSATKEAGFVNNSWTNYTDMNFPIEMMNYYWVKAYNIAGESGFSAVAFEILNKPDIPGPVISTRPFSDAQIDISWLNISHETSYALFRSTNANPNNAIIIAALNMNQTNYSDLSVLINTIYYYWVKAYNRAGESGFTAVTSSITGSIESLLKPDLNLIRLNSIYNSPARLYWSDVVNETSYTV